MSRESSFLLEAVRHFLRPERPLPRGSDLDWSRLAALASAHTVIPQLYLASLKCEAPQEWRLRLREWFENAGRFNLALGAELVRLVRLLESEGIEAVSLKGPALAAALYGNLALRASSDLDLLVRPQDFPRVRDLLRRGGYRQTSVEHWQADSCWRRARERQISFLDNSGQFSVDVHWDSVPQYIPENLDPSAVWSSLRSVAIGGFGVKVMAPHHLLLYLCAHGGKHGWERLAWICDLARVLQIEDGADWELVLAEARRTHTRRMLATGLMLARDLLGRELASPAERFIREVPEARALADEVWRRFQSEGRIPTPAVDMTGFCLRLFDRPSQRVRLVFGTWIYPSEADYRALKLPPGAFALYYFYRPLRLVARRLLGRTRWG